MRRSRVDRRFGRFRRTRDPRHLAAVFDATAGELLRVARHLAGEAAEDLVQTTFLTAIEHAEQWDEEQGVLPWLLGILANRARHLRRQEARTLDLARLARSTPADPLEASAAGELRTAVERSLGAMAPPYREVLVLHLEHGLEAQEIARALDRQPSTVRTQIVRGMELLRRTLPAGFAVTAVAIAVHPALAAVRAAVLERAAARVPLVASGASFALVGGSVVMKKLVLGLVSVAFLMTTAWVWWPATVPAVDGRRDEAPPLARHVNVRADRESRTRTPLIAGAAATDERLPPGRGALRVRARWADGGAAAGIHVQTWVPDARLDERWAETDATGTALLAPLAAGPLVVCGDRGGQIEAEVVAGATRDVELRIPAGVDVSGQVVDWNGVPHAARIWISGLHARLTGGFEVAATDPTGRFTLRSVAPRIGLSALTDGWSASSVVVVEGDPGSRVEIELRMAPKLYGLRGTVLGPDGRPRQGALVLVGVDHDVAGHVGPGLGPRPSSLARSDRQGQFAVSSSMRDPEPRLWVGATGCAPFVRDLRLHEGFEESVTVHLLAGATVRGVTKDRDGKRVAGVRVTALQDAIEPPANCQFTGPPWVRRATVSTADGSFVLEHLHPGTVKVTARRPPPRREDPAARQPHAEPWDAVTFVLADGEEREWNAVLADGRSIVGRVVDENGAPLAGATVWTDAAKNRRNPRPARTATDGRFVLTGCEDAPHTLCVRAQDSCLHGPDQTQEGAVPGGPPVTITVPPDRRASAWLTGTVLDSAGRPIAKASPWFHRLGTDVLEFAGGPPKETDAGRFQVGALIPGRYQVGVTAGEVFLDLGVHDLAAGQRLDLGEHRLPRCGRIVARLRDAEDRPLSTGMLTLEADGGGFGPSSVLMLADGAATSKPLAPGSYRIQTWGSPRPFASAVVEVAADRDSEVELVLRRGVVRELRWPPVARAGSWFTTVWRDARGEVVWVERSVRNNLDAAVVQPQEFVPGVYQVEVRTLDGRTGRATLVVGGQEQAEPFDLPVPR